MKINFRKISAIAASALMVGMTMGVAAAANFPSPYSASTSDGVAIVSGTGAGVDDLSARGEIEEYLKTQVTTVGGTPTGDSVLIDKASNHLNLGDGWSVFTGTIDDDDLSTLLADGTYIADDNDEFKFEQKITLGNPTLTHFRDTDYSDTPEVGFHLASNTFLMRYVLDFTTDAQSDIVTGNMDDIEGSDMVFMGKTYYVSELLNGSNANYFGKLTLLDSASSFTINEGETVTAENAGSTYDVSLTYMDDDEVKFEINGEQVPKSGKLSVGDSYKLADGAYLGVRDISKVLLAGETGSASFSLGSGKLEITSGSDIVLNSDETISGVKGYVHRGTGSGNTERISQIAVNWTTDEEMFLTPTSEVVMPGFEAIKFTMGELVRPTEEKITIQTDGDESMEMTIPIEDGIVSFNLLYMNDSGCLNGTGKDADNQLLTSSSNTIYFLKKDAGADDFHAYFVATYNTSTNAESYLLKAYIRQTSTRNETQIMKKVGSEWVEACGNYRPATDTCDIGDVTLTIDNVEYSSGGGQNVTLTGGTNVNFNTIFTKGGLKVYLPWEGGTNNNTLGEITFDGTNNTATGHSKQSFHLTFDGENEDDDLERGNQFNVTIDDTTSGTIKLLVTQVNEAGTAGANGRKVETNEYETYITNDPVAPRIMHYTAEDDDYVEVYYPAASDGKSETYAQVWLTEALSVTGEVGSMVFLDSDKASWQSRDVILVGGSCINSATATALGVAYPTCEAAFTTATQIGSGQYLIQSVGDAFTTGKIALVVAGYEKSDTAAAAQRLANKPETIDTTAGNKYLGITGTLGESTITKLD